ncbi:MAG: dihydropteroate synthase [Aquirufa sp.]
MDSLFPTFFAIRTKLGLLNLEIPAIMGILNATPDSFFTHSRVDSVEFALNQAAEMIQEGVSILDIGGHSTRPDAAPVSEQEEIDRVVPIIEALSVNFPEIILSIDTYRLKVAKASFQAGAHIFNDIGSGNMDDGIFDWICENQVPYILTHSVGQFEEVHQIPDYSHFMEDVIADLLKKVQWLRGKGLKDLIIDPGFGFSKTLEQNYEMLAQLGQFKLLGAPILVGVSRKSMITKLLGISANDSLNATSALHMAALLKGGNILRVHDVKEAKEVVDLFQKLKENGLSNL